MKAPIVDFFVFLPTLIMIDGVLYFYSVLL